MDKTDKDAVAITKVKLNLGGKEIELTVGQAKKLKAALDDLFGKEVVREYGPGWYWYYNGPHVYPQWTYTTTTENVCDDGHTLTVSVV